MDLAKRGKRRLVVEGTDLLAELPELGGGLIAEVTAQALEQRVAHSDSGAEASVRAGSQRSRALTSCCRSMGLLT